MDLTRSNAEQLSRHNLIALTTDVTFFALGSAFIDANAVLPLLFQGLGASGTLIGFFSAVRMLGFNLPQVFIAGYAHRQPRKKPLLMQAATLTRLPLIIVPLLLMESVHGNTYRLAALWGISLILTIWGCGDGLGYVSWVEIVANSFTDTVRGRFFALTQILSGIITLLVGAIIVERTLKFIPFPSDFAILGALAAICFFVSLFGLYLVKEPPVHEDLVNEPVEPVALRALPALVRSNPVFLRLAAIQVLAGGGAMAAPFYVLYATRHFHLSDAWGGIYQAMHALGLITLMPLWTRLGERRGQNRAVAAIALGCCLSPLLAFTLGTTNPWLFGICFYFMGGTLDWGLWIVLNHYLLSHVSDSERPAYVSVFSLLNVPTALFPFLGGLLILHHHFLSIGSIPVLFPVTLLFTGAAFLLSMRLPTPALAS